MNHREFRFNKKAYCPCCGGALSNNPEMAQDLMCNECESNKDEEYVFDEELFLDESQELENESEADIERTFPSIRAVTSKFTIRD